MLSVLWSFLTKNIATIIGCVILAALVALIVWKLVRDRKRGKRLCGSNCAHCSMAGSCHKK